MRVTVSGKGQIVIPVELRHKYGIDRGTKLEVHEKEGRIELEPIPNKPILSLRGKYKGKTLLTADLLAERAKDGKQENVT